MDRTSGTRTPLAALVQAEEQGLDLNRLLFVKYLVLSGRITDNPRPSINLNALPLAA
jgi:hypothetical protein